MSNSVDHANEQPQPSEADVRLYLTRTGWTPQVNLADHRFYCYQMYEDESAYHRIAVGEIFVQQGDSAFCLNCAMKRGLLTVKRPVLGSAASIQINPPSGESNLTIEP